MWELVDGFGNVYHQEFTTNGDGIGAIDMSALPAGFANVAQAPLKIRVKESNSDCDYLPLTIIQHYESIAMDFKAGNGTKDWVACLFPGTTITPTLSVPTGFAGTTDDGHSVLTWNAVSDATGYIVKKGATVIYTGPLTTFDATGLTNGTPVVFTVIATAEGFNNSPAATITVTPAAVVVPITGYYLLADDATTPTESEILAGVSFSITDGSDYSIAFPNTDGKFWKVFEPSTQPVKTFNSTTFGPDAFGPDGTFGTGITVGSFRGYISNYATSNTSSATNFNQ